MESKDAKEAVMALIELLETQGLTRVEIERVFSNGIKQCRMNRYRKRGPKMEDQTWKPVLREGYEQYLVSNWGFVRHKTKSEYLKPAAEHQYARASMKAPNGASGARAHMIHELVYESFSLCATLASIGSKRSKKRIEIINHIDGDKWNPALHNLELASQGENMLHAYRTKLRVPRI